MKPAIVLTGAAGGIGEALARHLNGEGYAVVALDRRAGRDGDGIAWIEVDLAQLAHDELVRASLLEQIHAARGRLGADRIGALVNCAATQVVAPCAELKVEDFLRSLAVNVAAPFALSVLLHADLISSGGCIVNIGSVHAHLTKPGFCAYSTSKAALAGLTRALAVEWGDRIRVVSIEPAAIATPMLEAGFVHEPQRLAMLAATHPAGIIGQPEQVARWVIHLLADTSQFSNGTVINLDGGVSHRLHDPS